MGLTIVDVARAVGVLVVTSLREPSRTGGRLYWLACHRKVMSILDSQRLHSTHGQLCLDATGRGMVQARGKVKVIPSAVWSAATDSKS